MEDPRDLFVRYVRAQGKGFTVDRVHGAHVRTSVLETIFHVIADYIHTERNGDEGLSGLEKRYAFPQAFMDCEDPHAWLDAHRPQDDMGLMVYVFDNMYNMTPGKHRRALLYLINILDFDL